MIQGQETYRKVIKNYCFDCITERSRVLEIGAGEGFFSSLILEKNPKKYTIVEPDPVCVNILQMQYPNTEILQDDIFRLIPLMENAYDVVVAFGVLYHWSSPFKFLEDVVNIIQPEFICLDNPECDGVVIKDEIHNTTGNFWKLDQQRTVDLSVHLDSNIIKKSMQNLQYKCLLKRDMRWHQLDESKQQTILYKFERQ